jgi:cobalt-zinc-cadmium efflux system protein
MHQIQGHNHSHTHDHDHQGEKNIGIAFFLNLGFTIIEIIGGIWTNSVAILSDAIHDFGDSLSLGLAWYLHRVSKKGSDHKYSYGYKRFSLLGAIINSIVLTTGSVIILFETVPRILHPQETNAEGMFMLAILGIIINGAAVFRLRKGKSLNEKAVSLHLWEDVLGWVAILIGSVVMYFFDVPIIDPLLSIGISVYIIYHVYKNIRASLRILLQGTPEELNTEAIITSLAGFDTIDSIHDLHTWTIDGIYHIATLHVVLKQNTDMNSLAALKTEIREKLKELDISHATIEFETRDEECCLENCSK